MIDRDSMDFNDFRVVSANSAYRKASTSMSASSGTSTHFNRQKHSLTEVNALNIVLDVNVGSGWTRIRLKEVPKFIVNAFNMISKFGMDVNGIFRKEGNSARLNRLEVQNIYKGTIDIPSDYTVIDVCTLVKRFLRDLKPPLLDSEEFRVRLHKKACQARISNNFVLTREEMADMTYSEEKTERGQIPLLSDVHFSTLGYVMRQLNRIAAYNEQHKMSIENLALVLVGAVFGDRVHESKNQPRRCSQDDILAKKKQDMNVHVSAIKLLITNANLIGVRRDQYLTSSAIIRSSSAMPTMRCMSSGYETGSSDADVTSTTASTMKSGVNENTSSSSYRRDSEAAHKIVTARKKSEQHSKKKRSASFLPSFRDIRHKLSNIKRAKSPSPDRLISGHGSAEVFSSTPSTFDIAADDAQASASFSHQKHKKVARNESTSLSTGSTASGRQSRSQQSRRGNTNAASSRSSRDHGHQQQSKPTLAKLFDVDLKATNAGPLRRLSQSEQNQDSNSQTGNEIMSVTEFILSEYREANDDNRAKKRVTRNRRHTAPVNNGLRRHRPNTVGAGLPQRRATLLGSSSVEEKENHRNTDTDDSADQLLIDTEASKALLEQKAMEARSRRAGRKTRPKNGSTESMKVLNGSMVTDTSVEIEPVLNTVKEESPQKPVLKDAIMPSDSESSVAMTPTMEKRKDLEKVKKEFCDMATSPVVFDTPLKPNYENGHAWIGTKQVVSCSPSLARRQSRTRLSYSKANESPLEMPERRESNPIAMAMMVSPIMRHVVQTNCSPPAHIVTGSERVSPRISSTVQSPLVARKNVSTPPPVPPHSPPMLTPQTSKSSLDVKLPGANQFSPKTSDERRRPPIPPANPKMSDPFSPRLPIRSTGLVASRQSSFENLLTEQKKSSPVLFKLPQLPAGVKKPTTSSPLTRQPMSLNSLSSASTSRGVLRESRSIDTDELNSIMQRPSSSIGMNGPLSASCHMGSMSPNGGEFEFGKFTNVLKAANCERHLPSRRCVDSRPSVAIIRQNNNGLVKSRVHQFQEIEQLSKANESLMSGRMSAMSQTSLRSNNSDRVSDASDRCIVAATSASRSDETMVITPTQNRPSRSSFDPVNMF